MRWSVFLGLMGACLLTFILSVSLGASEAIPIQETFRILLGGTGQSTSWNVIIWELRIPRALTACLAGSALSVGGLLMQTLFRNPLAGPFVLGIQSGASLGIALVMLTSSVAGFLVDWGFSGDYGQVFAASIGAGGIMVLVLWVARYVAGNTVLLILGLLFGYATGAMVSLLVWFSSGDAIRAFIMWGYGSFQDVTYPQLGILSLTILIGAVISFGLSKSLNVLLLGERYAQSLGVSMAMVRRWVVVATALLAGSVTAFCGPIVFIGIAVPHLCRGLFTTSDHKILLPAVMLMGALMTLWADILAQLPFSETNLPLNAITALIGTPIITWVILKHRKNSRSFEI